MKVVLRENLEEEKFCVNWVLVDLVIDRKGQIYTEIAWQSNQSPYSAISFGNTLNFIGSTVQASAV